MRPACVHVQVDHDPVAVGERLGGVVARCALPPLRLDVQALELVRDRLEARRRDGGAPPVGIARAGLAVLGEAQNARRRELGLLLDTVRLDERAVRRRSLVAQTGEPLGRGNDDCGVPQEVGARLAPRGGGRDRAVQRHVPEGADQPDTNNVAPRIGFAWRIKPGNILRGGYGVSYNSDVIRPSPGS